MRGGAGGLATGAHKGIGPVGIVSRGGGSRGHQLPLQQGDGGGGLIRVGSQGGMGAGSSLSSEGAGVEGPGGLADGFSGLSLNSSGFESSKDELLGAFPCVRLRGLAPDTTVKDILDFFVGLGPVLDIVLEGNVAEGSIEAVTLFGNLMDFHGALQRYSLQLKGRYIEVATAVRSDYYGAVQRS
ncbi:unnamed protein product, partial [Discosporangium mesarthrocarpum]